MSVGIPVLIALGFSFQLRLGISCVVLRSKVMIGGRFKVASVASIAAAGLFMGGVSAQAADLGGNCCADLEERVAELEATTARKGNRKVSLEVSGQVNRVVVWHDDDQSRVSKFSSRDNDGRSGSRFRFKGSAKIDADWSAGFLIEIGVDNNEEAATNNRANGSTTTNILSNSGGVLFRHTMLYVKSKTFGTLKLGRTNTATEGITEICLGCAITPNSAEEGSQVARSAVTGIDGNRRNGVHYVSPTVAGFVLSASWFHDTDPGGRTSTQLSAGTVVAAPKPHDDGWDVALRYAGEFGAMRVAAGIGYQEREDGLETPKDETKIVSGSASVMHVPTGLFLQGTAGQIQNEGTTETNVWYVSGGISQKFNSLGKTSFTIGYGESDTTGSTANPVHYGVGISQNIDAAAMDIYANWKHNDLDTGVDDTTNVFTVGGRIRF